MLKYKAGNLNTFRPTSQKFCIQGHNFICHTIYESSVVFAQITVGDSFSMSETVMQNRCRDII